MAASRLPLALWGFSSVGRAAVWQTAGHRFESGMLHGGGRLRAKDALLRERDGGERESTPLHHDGREKNG